MRINNQPTTDTFRLRLREYLIPFYDKSSDSFSGATNINSDEDTFFELFQICLGAVKKIQADVGEGKTKCPPTYLHNFVLFSLPGYMPDETMLDFLRIMFAEQLAPRLACHDVESIFVPAWIEIKPFISLRVHASWQMPFLFSQNVLDKSKQRGNMWT